MTLPEDIFARVLPQPCTKAGVATASAPANIALSKYWGKRDKALNLPLNSSVSISLGRWGTETQIAPADDDSLHFNGSALGPTDPFAAKVWRFVDQYRGGGGARLAIKTDNSIPTAAGLASSASGFAALTQALDRAFGTGLAPETLSMLARFGSGSATRSMWHGFVRWNRGVAADGSDSHGVPLDISDANLRIAIIPVDTGPKAHTSRDGMNHTVATSPLFATWPGQAEKDCAKLEAALLSGDFTTMGEIAEANALAMHATMMAARPALTYLKPGSWEVLETLWAARAEGLNAYATMDAGANVKLIFPQTAEGDVVQQFPQATVINPFENLD
ncbi:MAG: diphosphomevalonate decarboxylase [Pseudomonadota bacterium]